ncbi:MAG: hypothetical protein RIK87_21250 [Fuerstiella sp.]
MSDLLQSILEAAGRQHSEDGDTHDFLKALIQQTSARLKLHHLALWTQRGGTAQILTQLGSRVRSPDDGPLICSTPAGQVHLATTADVETERRLLTASALVDDLRLVLDVTEGGASVDDDVLLHLTDIFADLQRRRLLEAHLQQSDSERRVNQLLTQLHSSLDQSVVANSLATDGAAVLGCIRASVVRRSGRSWNVVATTGVSQPDHRSDASRQIRSWVEQAATEHGVADHGVADHGADGGSDRHPVVRPLEPQQNWQKAGWAVVLEFPEHAIPGQGTIASEQCLNTVLQHATLALANCDARTRATAVGRVRSGWQRLTGGRWGIVLTALAVLVTALLIVPATLRIEVYGALAPTERSFVFAPDDGTIAEVFVEDGTRTEAGRTLLCVLQNEDLQVQLESIAGQLAAANARLAAIDAMRGTRIPGADNNRLLSAEQAELKEEVVSLTKQADIVRERLQLLNVVSRIDGRVYGDRLVQFLTQRPVTRGQFLFEVANPASGWQLELKVPEADSRHVLRAMEQQDAPLTVSFALETSPESVHQTQLRSLASSVDLDEQGQLSTKAFAPVSDSDLHQERPGAGVIAYIHCGQRPVGYVWFRRIIEFVQRHTWL